MSLMTIVANPWWPTRKSLSLKTLYKISIYFCLSFRRIPPIWEEKVENGLKFKFIIEKLKWDLTHQTLTIICWDPEGVKAKGIFSHRICLIPLTKKRQYYLSRFHKLNKGALFKCIAKRFRHLFNHKTFVGRLDDMTLWQISLLSGHLWESFPVFCLSKFWFHHLVIRLKSVYS